MRYDVKKLLELEESLNVLRLKLIELENDEFSSQYIVDLMMATIREIIDRYNFQLRNTGVFIDEEQEVINNTIIDFILKRIKFHVNSYNGTPIIN